MPLGARRSLSFSEQSVEVLAESSQIRLFANKALLGGVAKGTSLEVYVNGLTTVADYVPGTGVAITNDGSNYVTVGNRKEKAINEILDGLTVEDAPEDYVMQRMLAGVSALAEQVDKDGYVRLVTDGTELVAAAGAKPTAATIYADILALRLALDNAKASQMGRWLIVTPEMSSFLSSPDAKVQLSTPRGDSIQVTGFVGQLAGFNVVMSTLLPAGTNLIAVQEQGFVHKDDFVRSVIFQDLDASGTFIGDSAIQGRLAYKQGVVRPTLVQVNNGAV